LRVVAILFLSSLITALLLTPSIPSIEASAIEGLWAVIISGFMPWPIGRGTIDNDLYDLRATLYDHYGFNAYNTYYCLQATAETLQDAINWLASKSDSDDLVFIFLASHGGGWKLPEAKLEGGRIDSDGDEGPEVWNETADCWFGVDECLYFERDGSVYWDDDLRDDLANIAYGRMIIVFISCRFENQTEGYSCFSGGFIDDLSGARRVIITSTNETSHSYGDWSLQRGFFSKWFVWCLDPDKPDFEFADENGDGSISMGEAYWYARINDEKVESGEESPWIDDDGDRLPTLKGEKTSETLSMLPFPSG